MSLFGFVKDIGNRVFNKDEDAAEKIREHIIEAGVGIRDFKVFFTAGVVTLEGEVDSKAANEKAVLIAGNVAGVADVLSNLKVAADAPKEPEVEFYVIKAGDTLGKIAKRVYGDAMQYPKIFEANKEVIKDPDKIFVGQKIRIPK